MHDGWVEIEFVFSCCVMLGIGSMMKPAWKSSQAESLKKAPLCAETLEKLCMTELNIVNIIIQTTKKSFLLTDGESYSHTTKNNCTKNKNYPTIRILINPNCEYTLN